MYKVFFVDDEASMRTGIRESIDWDKAGFALAGEAPDGEMALSLMQDIMPDILLTDVKMPFMDGLELARRTRKTMPWIKIVIISGHDEFEYAKQAITIGVEDYLLKPVTSSQLIETLNEIAGRIEEEKEKLRNVEELLEGTRRVRAERLISDLLYGGIGVKNALAMAEELDLPVAADYYMVMQIELYLSSNKNYNYFYNARDCALGVLIGWENAIFFSQGSDRVICVLKGADPRALEEDAYNCAHAVKYEVERNGPCSVAVAIGSIVTDIKKWPKSLADADAARRYINLTGRKQIISVQDINAGGLIPFSKVNRLPTIDKLRYATEADIPEFVEDCMTSADSAGVASFMFVNYIFVDILIAASKIIEELGGDANEALSGYSDISGLLSANSDMENAKQILTSILGRIIEYRNAAIGSKYNEVIVKAQEYIQKNYSEQDISLHSVAKEVNISPNHFSTIFSQETGETFISYITRVRLEQAKALLKTTAMRTSEIGYEVGYNDTHYFSYVFKKNTGMTPKEFRAGL